MKSKDQKISEIENYIHGLGEITSLVIHDLSGPLHTIQFCIDELKKSPDLIHNPKYLAQLEVNTYRSLELINSLRSHLKGQLPDGQCFFEEAHHSIIKLLQTQYREDEFNHISIQLDSTLEGVGLNIDRISLIHILYNLYKNSFDNLITNKVSRPSLKISLRSGIIYIVDNGTGLSKKSFDEITGTIEIPHKALGLFLTRRLIEKLSGQIDISSTKANSGTVFSIIFPNEHFIGIGGKT